MRGRPPGQAKEPAGKTVRTVKTVRTFKTVRTVNLEQRRRRAQRRGLTLIGEIRPWGRDHACSGDIGGTGLEARSETPQVGCLRARDGPQRLRREGFG